MLVVVVRAVREGSLFWVRLMVSGDASEESSAALVRSVDEACGVLRAWLLPLEGGEP
jgi:hypothetical protein